MALLEDIVVEYVTDLVHKAQDIASKRGKVLTEDFLYLVLKVVTIPLLSCYPYIAMLSGTSLLVVLSCASVLINVLMDRVFTFRPRWRG